MDTLVHTAVQAAKEALCNTQKAESGGRGGGVEKAVGWIGGSGDESGGQKAFNIGRGTCRGPLGPQRLVGHHGGGIGGELWEAVAV